MASNPKLSRLHAVLAVLLALCASVMGTAGCGTQFEPAIPEDPEDPAEIEASPQWEEVQDLDPQDLVAAFRAWDESTLAYVEEMCGPLDADQREAFAWTFMDVGIGQGFELEVGPNIGVYITSLYDDLLEWVAEGEIQTHSQVWGARQDTIAQSRAFFYGDRRHSPYGAAYVDRIMAAWNEGSPQGRCAAALMLRFLRLIGPGLDAAHHSGGMISQLHPIAREVREARRHHLMPYLEEMHAHLVLTRSDPAPLPQ